MDAKKMQAEVKEMLRRNYGIMLADRPSVSPSPAILAMLDACAANLAQSYADRIRDENEAPTQCDRCGYVFKVPADVKVKCACGGETHPVQS